MSGLVALSLWSLRWTREIAGALGIFLLLLAPSFLNVARRGDAGMVDLVIASDRYMYLPSLALIVLVGYWLLVTGYPLSPVPSPAAAGEGGTTAVRVRGCLLFLGFVGLLGFFGFLTHRQLRVWHDSEALFRNVLTQHLSSHIAANNLAGFLAKKGEIAEAMDFYRQSLAVRENPRALFNLGRLLMSEKRFREALPLFERYVALKPRDAFGRMQLGGLYLMQDDPMSARPHLEGAVARDPNLTEAHYLLGVAFEQLGDGTRARKEFQETLRLEPNHPHARGKLGKFPPPVFDSEAQTRGAGEG
ncbi:tetratricopeptide repeat protein [Candidatus Peregrinibacteria bacterium]|nr:tetratricopeptide repeat protein [Candidatus Peregrinibacteria bacterium]